MRGPSTSPDSIRCRRALVFARKEAATGAVERLGAGGNLDRVSFADPDDLSILDEDDAALDRGFEWGPVDRRADQGEAALLARGLPLSEDRKAACQNEREQGSDQRTTFSTSGQSRTGTAGCTWRRPH